jgi:hypothetical protein
MTTTSVTLKDLLPLTCKLFDWLNQPYVIAICVPMLIYHLWVYIYLGHLTSVIYFYTGCMYAFNYAGTCVAYWIIYRQSQASHLMEMSNIIWSDKDWNRLEGSHYQLVNDNLTQLSKYESSYRIFKRYCLCWERLLKLIFLVWWGVTLVNVILNILQDCQILFSYQSFDDQPLGLWGYYNLSGQLIAAPAICIAAVAMMSGFYQLTCLITGFAFKLRDYRDQVFPTDEMDDHLPGNLIRHLRREYQSIQASCLAYSELWSVPIVVALTFCSQVLISSIFVIHYSVQDCIDSGRCEIVMIFPFIWLFAALAIMAIILNSIARVNSVTHLVRDVFIYADGDIATCDDDYASIGGRANWLEYLDSNPLSLSICGMVITTKLVVNTGYTVGVAIGSFLASNVFG